MISVAARLVEMHPQTLRKYEREGLIAPSRTSGNLRLYSDSDIERLRQVKYLVEQRGLNLAGVQLALELTHQVQDLRGRIVAATDGRKQSPVVAELDAVLESLGFVDEQKLRDTQRRDQTRT
ncbi:MAG TPA: MerR family transcriptional regulator [Thermomicrobiales bacterium]|nr:MerR family transcriptional regulator [Thermomicrobiales bacterium]